MTFNPNLPCATKRGRPVEVVAVLDAPDENGDAIVGVITDMDGNREIQTWRADGTFNVASAYSGLDLVNVNPRYRAASGDAIRLWSIMDTAEGVEVCVAHTKASAELIVKALNR